MALRGGRFSLSSGAGLFGLVLIDLRLLRSRGVGFRPALAPSRRKPEGYGFRDGTGAKGDCFLPRCEAGKQQRSRAASSRGKRGAGAFFDKEVGGVCR